MSNDKTQKFAHLAEQIVQACPIDAVETMYEEQILLAYVSRGLYDAIAQTIAHVAPAFEQAGYGHVNIEWESIMEVIDIPTLREGWEKA